ncbi:asparagine synthase C-terminal domain-containing protein [Haloplanus aerogenes]|uniref:Asparagine synthetase B n=1 Tax=Haloplanus aerogenes TaxID=660522 RepID=A0A3G8QY54_9EURY|nr:asparagine synthase-related protein [Haloplanus aerogenes]AZH27195.1 asparagine synthetase B [Haloplanus aerogenes]
MRGADVATVRRALDSGDSLPGTSGFAGELEGRLVRDVLGRQPVFGTPNDWGFAPADVDGDPSPVPAGHVRNSDGTDRRVWSLPDPPVATDDAAAVDALRDALDDSLTDLGGDGLAIAFSGGVDSGLVATGAPDAPCYVVGFPDSHDVEAARAAADAMDRDLRIVDLDHADLERAVPEVVTATGRTNAMDVCIALPLYLVAERAAADGFDRLAVGQGADELFGGYAKVVDPADDDRVDATTVRGATREVIGSLPSQLERDTLVLRAAGVEPITPFLTDAVVTAALPLPDHLLATGTERKVALRLAARDRLPESVVTADKKAVQYGSLVSRELDRLARQAGYKRRMDDHLGQYIRSLC